MPLRPLDYDEVDMSGGKVHAFLTFVVEESEWLASCSSRCLAAMTNECFFV